MAEVARNLFKLELELQDEHKRRTRENTEAELAIRDLQMKHAATMERFLKLDSLVDVIDKRKPEAMNLQFSTVQVIGIVTLLAGGLGGYLSLRQSVMETGQKVSLSQIENRDTREIVIKVQSDTANVKSDMATVKADVAKMKDDLGRRGSK